MRTRSALDGGAVAATAVRATLVGESIASMHLRKYVCRSDVGNTGNEIRAQIELHAHTRIGSKLQQGIFKSVRSTKPGYAFLDQRLRSRQITNVHYSGVYGVLET